MRARELKQRQALGRGEVCLSRPMRARELKQVPLLNHLECTASRPMRARELKQAGHDLVRVFARRAPCGRVN